MMNQNGFRSGRSTLGQILALRRLIEGIKAKQLQAIITFRGAGRSVIGGGQYSYIRVHRL